MKVINVTEHEDGSAILNLDLSTEETRLLVEKGMQVLLMEMLEREEKSRKVPALLKEPYGSE